MATWWEEYRTLLGSSSTGQWTMVAFYVCFRATTEETIHASILRTIGHGLGALLSWALNTAIESSGGRMSIHVGLTLVLTWFIPPPFVYPSSFSFSWDAWAAGILEGLLTTYHLTSVLVTSTDIRSATKARALSQCLGALAAAVVSTLILPWFGKPRAQQTLRSFQQQIIAALQQDADVKDAQQRVHDSLDELLDARRDVSSIQEAQGWIPSRLQTMIGISSLVGGTIDKAVQTSATAPSQDLTMAAFEGFALESLLARMETTTRLQKNIKEYLEAGDFDQALTLLRETFVSVGKTDESVGARNDLATMYILILLLQASSSKANVSSGVVDGD
jgi:hypothetical protein